MAQQIGDGNSGEVLNIGRTAQSVQIGGSTATTVGFYGITPVAQRAGADQVAVTAAAGTKIGTGILADASAGFSQSITNNNNATIAASLAEIRAALVALGVIKGAA